MLMLRKCQMQPLYIDENNTIRFKENALVTYLLEKGGLDMNDLYNVNCSQEDREQFAQLIGYSLSGFSELSYVSDKTYNKASRKAKVLQDQLDDYIVGHKNVG
jgi:hypothetical protein